MTWLGTIAHELTHAIDYYQMARKEKLDCYGPLLKTASYLMFQLWSEYHAKRLGYGFMRRLLNMDINLAEDEANKYARAKEWDRQVKDHWDEYHGTVRRDSVAIKVVLIFT